MNDFPRNSHPGSDTGTTSKISTKTGEWKPEWNQPVSFPEWHEILAIEPLDALTRERFACAIITELIELRVQSLDLDRQRVLVFGGKGNKDRATVLAKKLVPKLGDHLDRLRELFAKDRENNAFAVWLPRGVG